MRSFNCKCPNAVSYAYASFTALQSLQRTYLLKSLYADALQVFCTLISALLGELLDDDDEVTGVTYEHLFRVCRERLLVSSDETLKAHLTEYKDHDLLKRRKTQDGVELLYIPLPVAELQKLLDVLQGPTGEA